MTEGDSALSEGKIEAVYSYGPENENRSANAPFGRTTLQDEDSASTTYQDDLKALDTIIAGDPAAGISVSEIKGVDNEDAHRIFSAPSAPANYQPVPALVRGSTNSNSETQARAQAAAAKAGTT